MTGRTEILICVKCRDQQTIETGSSEGEQRPGALLFERLADNASDTVRLTPVECLSNCSRGCSIALRAPGKWSYVYGNLSADDAALILDGAEKYDATDDGLVPWRTRPEHFRKNCIARIPPMET